MKFLINRFTLLLFIVMLYATSGDGQVPYFQHYSLLKKNEPVQINAIFQDKKGFIWYGTNRGLFKFDGINLQRFTAADSLPDENVTALAADSLGRLWIGHKNGQLSFLENGVVKKFDPPEGAATREVSDILFDREGNLWFSTLNDGLYYFTEGRLFRLDENDGMPDIFVYDMEEDSVGNIWVGTDGGAVLCSLRDRKVKITVYNYKNGLPDNIIKKLVRDSDGTMWMGTEDAGVVNYNPITGKYKPLLEEGWRFGVITDFIIDDDQVWISSLQTGLVVYDRNTKQAKLYNAKSGPGFTSIMVLLKDKEGDIWAGSKSDIMRTRGDHVEFIDAFDPVKDLNVLAVAVDKTGSIWFSNSQGLFKRTVDPDGRPSFERPLAKSAMEKYTVISLYVDQAGFIWAGLYGEGVVRINPISGAIRYLNKELRNGNVLGITGRDNVIWLATLGGGTEIKTSGDQMTVRNYTSQDGLISDYIYQVFIDSQERVWFATDGKGVDMMDTRGFHHFQAGLNSKVVYGFAEDREHRLWVNVQGDGLYQLEGEKFVAFDPQGKHLRDNNISCFSSTLSGNLVIMHDLGLDIYDVTNNKIHYLGEEVGIRDKKPNLNALAKDALGHIFVGTDGGIIKYSDHLDRDLATPEPIIEGFNVMNQDVDFSRDLSFRYNQNDVTIHYLGLWYEDPTSLNYQYRLKTFDREWILSRNHSVTYSSLPPGNYTFEVKVSATGDFSLAKATSLDFIIRPPFWQTSWFYFLSIVAVFFIVYLVIRYRERKLMKDKHILEERVEERTLEIILKNEEIHAQAEEIRGINENLERLVKERTSELEKKNRALEEYAFINAHELRAPVASILGLISLMETLKLDEDEKIYLEHLQTSAERLDEVVRSIGKAIEKGG